MERLAEGKSDAGCRYLSRLPDRMRFCTLAAVAAAVLSVDGSRHALRHHTLYRAAAEFCHFADVCLYTGGDAVVYGFHRFTDTMVGLAVALVVNIVIRPYNNRQKILDMMHELQKQFLPLLEARVIAHRYPDLAPLRNKMAKLDDELRIFEKQPVALFHHTVRVSARRQEAAYLRGCQQLLDKMGGELAALCNMDSSPVSDDEMLARLKEHGIAVPEDLEKYGYCSEVDTAVMNFHVGNLLDAYDYLSILHHG